MSQLQLPVQWHVHGVRAAAAAYMLNPHMVSLLRVLVQQVLFSELQCTARCRRAVL